MTEARTSSCLLLVGVSSENSAFAPHVEHLSCICPVYTWKDRIPVYSSIFAISLPISVTALAFQALATHPRPSKDQSGATSTVVRPKRKNRRKVPDQSSAMACVLTKARHRHETWISHTVNGSVATLAQQRILSGSILLLGT